MKFSEVLDKRDPELSKWCEKVLECVSDYRADEEDSSVKIAKEDIRMWICQFETELRIPILTELENIFQKRYCSKEDAKDFLEKVISALMKDFKFSTPQELLRNIDFLDLQPAGKSQGVMLELLDELIQEKWDISLEDCGTVSKRYSVYIDDILCTGLTLINDVIKWSEKQFSSGKSNVEAVADGSTKLVFAYIFIHKKNYYKKVKEMKHKISDAVSEKHDMYRLFEIENESHVNSKVDLILPEENNQPQNVIDYRDSIIERVDQRSDEKGWKRSPNEFHRGSGIPRKEEFFTTAENRIIVENAFLHKGIEILDRCNSQIPNMRALGYSLPTLKDFGFGALCFTWRNIPNNAPLVFWYSGGGFTPLFKAHRGDHHRKKKFKYQ